MGDWVRDISLDEFFLVGCPAGYKLENASGHDNLECQKCLDGYYVQNSHDPNSVCRKCPSSATCVNGRPPVFNAVKMEGTVELELPEKCDDETVRQAMAVHLRVDPSKMVLSSRPCDKQQRRAKQKISFKIVGETSELASLQKILSKMGVPLGEIKAEGQKILEDEVWEQIDGVYYLRQCPPGHLLVNTTLELQKCHPCLSGTYLEEGSSRCTECPEGKFWTFYRSHIFPFLSLPFLPPPLFFSLFFSLFLPLPLVRVRLRVPCDISNAKRFSGVDW